MAYKFRTHNGPDVKTYIFNPVVLPTIHNGPDVTTAIWPQFWPYKWNMDHVGATRHSPKQTFHEVGRSTKTAYSTTTGQEEFQ